MQNAFNVRLFIVLPESIRIFTAAIDILYSSSLNASQCRNSIAKTFYSNQILLIRVPDVGQTESIFAHMPGWLKA